MIHLLAANTVLFLHLLFICLVMFGAVAALRWRRFAFIHVPAAIWGFLVEAFGWYCPLTELENVLLRKAGEEGYTGGFIENYLLAIIYPDGLTREIQVALAVIVLLVNGGLYGWMLVRCWAQKPTLSDR
jgi:hypothetical protein